MGGGLMQLVAYGAQDIYLTGNPQITFFKVVYRRHTNFAMEQIEQTFSGTADFGRRVTATVSRNGDLIHDCYLEVQLPTLKATNAGQLCDKNWTNSIAHALLEKMEVEIGGQVIDKQYGEWLEIWSELAIPECKRRGYNDLVGKYDSYCGTINNGAVNKTLYVPLQFWFCRNPGLALPLIALQYHEVKFAFEFRQLAQLYGSYNVEGDSGTSLKSTKLWVNYIYLDTDERRRFAQVSHEYLIEQLQHTGSATLDAGTSSQAVNLNYNHPVKSLYWVFRDSTNENANKAPVGAGTGSRNNRWMSFAPRLITASGRRTNNDDSDVTNLPFTSFKLQLNGHDRFTERNESYFRKVQPHRYHTRCPDKYVYMYSFGLKPEEHQPSGSCNFSRIDNAVLNCKRGNGSSTGSDVAGKLLIYALNYNVLRIMSGMGGLAYSN